MQWSIALALANDVKALVEQQVVDIGGGRGVEGVSCPKNGEHHIGKIYLSEANKTGWLNHARKAE